MKWFPGPFVLFYYTIWYYNTVYIEFNGISRWGQWFDRSYHRSIETENSIKFGIRSCRSSTPSLFTFIFRRRIHCSQLLSHRLCLATPLITVLDSQVPFLWTCHLFNYGLWLMFESWQVSHRVHNLYINYVKTTVWVWTFLKFGTIEDEKSRCRFWLPHICILSLLFKLDFHFVCYLQYWWKFSLLQMEKT